MLTVLDKATGNKIQISDELLDDKKQVVTYKTKDGKIEKITEKEYRKRLFATGGFTNHQTWHQGHEGTEDSYSVQKEATLKYKYFNPRFHAIVKEQPKEQPQQQTNEESQNA